MLPLATGWGGGGSGCSYQCPPRSDISRWSGVAKESRRDVCCDVGVHRLSGARLWASCGAPPVRRRPGHQRTNRKYAPIVVRWLAGPIFPKLAVVLASQHTSTRPRAKEAATMQMHGWPQSVALWMNRSRAPLRRACVCVCPHTLRGVAGLVNGSVERVVC